MTMALSSSGTSFSALGGSIYALSSTSTDNANASTITTLNVTSSYAAGTAAAATFYIEYKDNSRPVNNTSDQTITAVPNVQW